MSEAVTFVSVAAVLSLLAAGRTKPALALALFVPVCAAVWHRAGGRRSGGIPRTAPAALVAAFCGWAVPFVLASSTVIEGRRYFGLFDDAMISLRYAWNATHGDGLTWNPGERVEGFSNPLMVLAMAVPSAVRDKAHAVLAVHVFGALAMVLFALLVAQLAVVLLEEDVPPGGSRALVMAATLGYYPIAFWSLRGMEQSLIALSATSAAVLILRRDEPPPRFVVPVLLGALCWCRPDAGVQALVLLGFRAQGLGRARWRVIVQEVAALAAIVGALFLLRRWYFEAWLPNTYYLKLTGLPLGERLHEGAVFVAPFLRDHALLIVLAVAALIRAPSRARALVLALLASAVVYQVAVGGDAWTYWRIMAPYVPAVLVCALAGARGLAERMTKGPLTRPIAAGLAALALVLANRPFAGEQTVAEPPTGTTTERRQIRAAMELAKVLEPPGASVGVIHAGTVPYYTGLRGVDFLGKCDQRIARLPADLTRGADGKRLVPGHNKHDLAYSIGVLQPEYIEADHWGRDDMHAFVMEKYARGTPAGLWLLRGSPRVRWDRMVNPVGRTQ